jgi:resuscitation-promoting factor RpfA
VIRLLAVIIAAVALALVVGTALVDAITPDAERVEVAAPLRHTKMAIASSTTTSSPTTTPPARKVHRGAGEWPWDALAKCESGGNWQIDAFHDGGLQFHPNTWRAYARGITAYAWQATREQQIAVARRVLAAQGWGAWPTCARRLGLL